MATRADQILSGCTIVERTVEAAATVFLGDVVMDGNADHECLRIDSAVALPIGVVVMLGKLAGAAGDKVSVALLVGGVAKVRVGAGGATRGQSAKYVSAGRLTDAVPDYTGADTDVNSPGYFTQNGADGDYVGLALVRHAVGE